MKQLNRFNFLGEVTYSFTHQPGQNLCGIEVAF